MIRYSLLRWGLLFGLAWLAAGDVVVAEFDAVDAAQLEQRTPTTDDGHEGLPSLRRLLRSTPSPQVRVHTDRRESTPIDQQTTIASSRASAQVRCSLCYIAHLTLVECGSLSSRTTTLPPPAIS